MTYSLTPESLRETTRTEPRRWLVFISIPLGRGKSLGEVCCAIESHVDRTFLIEVSSISAA